MTRSLRILAVDDSMAIQALLQTVLRAAGYEVMTANGPREALRRLRNFDPHIILTDFNMPGIDGHEFVRLLRRNPRFDETPVFVLSSETCPAKRQQMDEVGASGWFGKPIDARNLLLTLQAAGRVVCQGDSRRRAEKQDAPSFAPDSGVAAQR